MMSLVWLHGEPTASGVLKASPEDFCVREDLGFEPDGEGEHVLVYLRKTGCNTQFVADHLARFAKIPARSVSYAGLKDRHAVTEQWFCLQMPGKETPDFSTFELEGCEILNTDRHLRKIRIGTLRGNSFSLTLRHISDSEQVESRLQSIKLFGVPNYFGEQRFGHNGNNITQAERWAKNEIRVNERNKRSFYLSAARSAMFNHIASSRIEQGLHKKVLAGDAMQLTGRGSWFVAQPEELDALQQRLDDGELQVTAPLPGDRELGTKDQTLAFEQQILSEYQTLMSLVTRERVENARRAVLLMPQHMQWSWSDSQTLSLNFWLPSGCFATSVVRELMLTGGMGNVAEE
ncbi:tRNA pseudouridine(13) synthase TruD [Budvicia diplopodorum]|uniref:tRNA pseudouridine(13) synthase TruD n=1 Tax=Budvicia diplopodorum TaxID=1119056 RepID=UPI003CCCC3A7